MSAIRPQSPAFVAQINESYDIQMTVGTILPGWPLNRNKKTKKNEKKKSHLTRWEAGTIRPYFTSSTQTDSGRQQWRRVIRKSSHKYNINLRYGQRMHPGLIYIFWNAAETDGGVPTGEGWSSLPVYVDVAQSLGAPE